jgi:TATA-box binding protein (TBP) (component of TFIID and TFIIIB)
LIEQSWDVKNMKSKLKKDDPFGTKPKIANIVATGRFPREIDIIKVYQGLDFPIKEYEPETYPALLVKVEVNGNLRHVTIYKNGKYIITGANSEKDVTDIYETIFKKLKNFGCF